jgi:hypothetical protein
VVAKPHRSVIVLADSDGKVRFAGEGPLAPPLLAALVAELKALGCSVD